MCSLNVENYCFVRIISKLRENKFKTRGISPHLKMQGGKFRAAWEVCGLNPSLGKVEVLMK